MQYHRHDKAALPWRMNTSTLRFTTAASGNFGTEIASAHVGPWAPDLQTETAAEDESAPKRLAALANSLKVDLIDCSTGKPWKAVTRFKDVVRCARFRPKDGRLLAASDDTGLVQVFDVSTRGVLRRLKGHTQSVRCCAFAPTGTHVVSGGDDSTLRLWDFSQGKSIREVAAHGDFIRALAEVPGSGTSSEEAEADLGVGVWATGGYDGVVKLWDFRAPKPVGQIQIGCPVESTFALHKSSILAVGSGTGVRFWDTRSTATEFRPPLEPHMRTVTHAGCIPASKGTSIIVTTSLDQTAKFHSISTRTNCDKAEHLGTVNLSRAVSAAAAYASAPGDRHSVESHPLISRVGGLVVGCANGEWTIRVRSVGPPTPPTHDEPTGSRKRKAAAPAAPPALPPLKRATTRSTFTDNLMKSFQYWPALMKSLESGAAVFAGMIDELQQRERTEATRCSGQLVEGRSDRLFDWEALEGRYAIQRCGPMREVPSQGWEASCRFGRHGARTGFRCILPLLQGIHRFMGRDPKTTRSMVELTIAVIDANSEALHLGINEPVTIGLKKILHKISTELLHSTLLHEICGAIDMVRAI
eukprot:Polyplicarium_translucidae@DN1955_c0_g1_i2.p1